MANIIGTIFSDNGIDFPALFGTPDADHLDGLQGADVMDGGDGSDTYIVDNVGDKTSEFFNDAQGGVDTVFASASHTIGDGIEHLTLTGSANINGTGNANNNTITGNDVANVLSGLGGNDKLFGRSGADTLDGGDGNDVLHGEVGNDQLEGGSGNDFVFGEAGLDTLDGGDGNDILNGGSGADIMNGWDGNDTYIVDNVGDEAFEVLHDFGAGVDTVQSSVTHTLSFALEHLTMTGASAINGTGNSNNNIITGNNAVNSLSGLAGNDTINGLGGNDFINGGIGNDLITGGIGKDTLTSGNATDRDIFDYNAINESPAGTSRDVITDFRGLGTAVGDKIDLSTIDANQTSSASGNQAFIWGGPFTAGHLRYVGGVLQGNTDGDAAAEFEIQLIGAPALFVQAGHPGSDILL